MKHKSKILILGLLLLPIVCFANSVELSKVSMGEIQKYETQFLKELQEKKTSIEVIQSKYLLAAQKFSEEGLNEKSIYLLEQGSKLVPPSVEYNYMHLTLLSKDSKKFNALFKERYGKELPSNLQNEDVDNIAELTVTYMRLNSILSYKLPSHLKTNLEKSNVQDMMKWNDSIQLAKSGDFKSSLDSLKGVDPIGHDDSVYRSYLQVKNGLVPKYCTLLMSQPDQLAPYKKTCKIMMTQTANVEADIVEAGELMKMTAIHEVVVKK